MGITKQRLRGFRENRKKVAPYDEFSFKIVSLTINSIGTEIKVSALSSIPIDPQHLKDAVYRFIPNTISSLTSSPPFVNITSGA